MSSALPYSATCCTTCDDPTTVNVPGPAGAAGAVGAVGAAGTSAYTVTTADFVVPAYAANVNISVAVSNWCTVGQIIYIQGAGYYQVINKPDSTTITAQNIESAGGAYATNAAPATVIATGSTVSPAGLQGVNASLVGVAAGGDLAGTYPDPTLSAMTSNGDMIMRLAGATARLPVGTAGQALQAVSIAGQVRPYWRSVVLSGATPTSISGQLPIINGGTGKSPVITATTTDGLNNLLPAGVAGDIYWNNGTTLQKLPRSAIANSFLTQDIVTGVPSWSTVTAPATATKKFKAILTTNIVNLVAGVENIVIFNVESATPTIATDAFDPDSTYTINATESYWKPAVVGYVSLSTNVKIYTKETNIAFAVSIWRYDTTAATNVRVATSDQSLYTTGEAYMTGSVSAVSIVRNVLDVFWVTVNPRYSGPNTYVVGDSNWAFTTFSGFTLP